MFQTGRRYEFKMLEGEDEVTFWDTVVSEELPLIKLARGQIINTHSRSFLSADLVKNEEEKSAEMRALPTVSFTAFGDPDEAA